MSGHFGRRCLAGGLNFDLDSCLTDAFADAFFA